MGSVFEAKYEGRCGHPDCGEKIEIGDQVKYIDDELVHRRCDIPFISSFQESKPANVCSDCHMIHAPGQKECW